MAAIGSAASGNFSSPSTWTGGVVPTLGDSVTINTSHVVTVDGTFHVGDDTPAAFLVGGTLKASRIVSSSLTVRGLLYTSGSGVIDYGRVSTSDRIPLGVSATLILNSSATMANAKYGMLINDGTSFYSGGVYRQINTELQADATVGATSCVVNDATGWQIGDTIVFASSTSIVTNYEERTIISVTPGAGTTATIGFAALTYTHNINCPVGNRTSNVTIKSFNTTNNTYICLRVTSTASNNKREIENTSFENVSSDASQTASKVFISSSSLAIYPHILSMKNNFFYNCAQTSGMFIFNWNGQNIEFQNCGWFSTISGAGVYFANGTTLTLSGWTFYYCGSSHLTSAFSQGGQGCVVKNSRLGPCGVVQINYTNGSGMQFNNCVFHSVSAGVELVSVYSGDTTFSNCKFGSGTGVWGTPATPGYIFSSSSLYGQVFNVKMTDCIFTTPSVAFTRYLNQTNTLSILRIVNKNINPLTQEVYTANGIITRDETGKISGTSVKLSPTSSTNALTFTMSVPAPNGKVVGVSGILNRDTLNTTTVTLSGLGIIPSTYTASAAINTNETFFVSGMNNTGSDGILTVTISTTGTSGNLWADNISAPQASAIDFGAMGYWQDGLPVQLVTANTVSAGDVWNYLLSNATLSRSMGATINSINSKNTGLTQEEHDRLMSLHNVGGGGMIDVTKKHEEIIEKYEKQLMKKLEEIIAKIPQSDFSPILQKIAAIQPTDITPFIGILQGYADLISEIRIKMDKYLSTDKTYFVNEIDKKNTVLSEKEYIIQEAKKEIESMQENIKSLMDRIEKESIDKEEEFKIMEETYEEFLFTLESKIS